MEERARLFVGGAWSEPSGDVIDVISPHTEERIARVVGAGAEDVDRAVADLRAPAG